jgi:excisionase family DNA binding protein
MTLTAIGTPLRPALTTAEVMRLLAVRDRDTVYALVTSGRLPAARLGREYRFDPDVVAAFLRNDDATPQAARSDDAQRRRPRPPKTPPEWMRGVEPIIKRRGETTRAA